MTFISLFLRRLDEQRGLSEHQPQASILSIVDRTVKNKRKNPKVVIQGQYSLFPQEIQFFIHLYIE